MFCLGKLTSPAGNELGTIGYSGTLQLASPGIPPMKQEGGGSLVAALSSLMIGALDNVKKSTKMMPSIVILTVLE